MMERGLRLTLSTLILERIGTPDKDSRRQWCSLCRYVALLLATSILLVPASCAVHPRTLRLHSFMQALPFPPPLLVWQVYHILVSTWPLLPCTNIGKLLFSTAPSILCLAECRPSPFYWVWIGEMRRLLRVGTSRPEASTSALKISAETPASGITFVDNSRGASAATAELSAALDNALDQVDLSGEWLPDVWSS